MDHHHDGINCPSPSSLLFVPTAPLPLLLLPLTPSSSSSSLLSPPHSFVLPQVVLSKMGEALNYSPLYIEDRVMTENVTFRREVDSDGHKVS